MDEASAVPGGRVQWQHATIEALEDITPRIRRVVLRPERWHRPLAGQHLDIRLTADDGYQAQRSYSLLSPPEREGVYELGVELLPDGEVSPWFHLAAQVGEDIEVLGPVGGHFVWQAEQLQPVLLVGGGSGLVPLLAMAEQHALMRPEAPMMLVAGVRTLADVPLWPELQRWEAQGQGFACRLALSRDPSVPRAQDHAGRLREDDLAAALQFLGDRSAQSAAVYVCGRHAFVQTVVDQLRSMGVADHQVRTERFGG